MKTTILLALLLVLSSCGPDFEAYIVRFNRQYPTHEEKLRRQSIYLENWAEIDAINQNNPNYQAGENEFTDRTQAEKNDMAGLRPLVIPPVENPTHPSSKKLRGTLPLEVDWRTENKVSSVKNQGSCGSCWAFTSTALYESILMIQGVVTTPDLSEEYVLQCTTQNSPNNFSSSCGGGVLEYAIPFIVANGMPTEIDFPYTAGTWAAGTSGSPTTAGICNTTALIKQTNLSGQYVGTYSNLTPAEMQDIIAFAPVTGAMYAGGAFMSYTSGVYTGCPPYATAITQLNHAVLIVGYDANGNYIIKNSWGTNWGVNGFATISRDADCGLSFGPREIRGSNTQLQAAPTDFGEMLAFTLLVILSLLFI